jgi:hypothetical protein
MRAIEGQAGLSLQADALAAAPDTTDGADSGSLAYEAGMAFLGVRCRLHVQMYCQLRYSTAHGCLCNATNSKYVRVISDRHNRLYASADA